MHRNTSRSLVMGLALSLETIEGLQDAADRQRARELRDQSRKRKQPIPYAQRASLKGGR